MFLYESDFLHHFRWTKVFKNIFYLQTVVKRISDFEKNKNKNLNLT